MTLIEVEVDIEDYIDEVSDYNLIKELKSRGYSVNSKEQTNHMKMFNVKRYFCDMFGFSYHVDKEVLLKNISNIIKE